MKIGDRLFVEEDGKFWPLRDSPREPRRLVVRATVIWLSSTVVRVKLPKLRVKLSNRTYELPETKRDLDRFQPRYSWSNNRMEPDEACEWTDKAFYPKVDGVWVTADKASYYTSAAWQSHQGTFADIEDKSKRPPPDRSRLGIHAKLLGIDPQADRDQVIAAFREKAKTAHPDRGGDPTFFRQLIEARDAFLSAMGK